MLDDFRTSELTQKFALKTNQIGLTEPLPGTYEDKRLPVGFRTFKFLLDKFCALMVLPLIAVVAVALLVLNGRYNPGPLFFLQERMGRNGQKFMMWKFRTMLPEAQMRRGPNDPLEAHRITPLGGFLRATRIDELPNFFNVLRGEMSLVGPRPDAVNHALHFNEVVPGYSRRSEVAPGITGLAQVEMGYAMGEAQTFKKTVYDNFYIRNRGYRQELYILWRTCSVMLRGLGK